MDRRGREFTGARMAFQSHFLILSRKPEHTRVLAVELNCVSEVKGDGWPDRPEALLPAVGL